MTAVASRHRVVCLSVAVMLAAGACTTDQGGYGYLGINRSGDDVIITLDAPNSSPTRLPAGTRSGIAFGWTYDDGETLTVMDGACSVLGSTHVVGPSTVLTIGADRTLITDPNRHAFEQATERLISAESDRTCEPFRVWNRTKQDVIFRFGHQPGHELYVPACEDVTFDPAHRQAFPKPRPTAAEFDYEFAPGQPALTPTVTITAGGVSIGYLASSPPCRGLAPTSTPRPS